MTIREKYLKIVNKNPKDFEKIKALKEQCILENNKEYYYLFNLLLIDIYLEEDNFDEALNLITKDFSNIDSITFKSIYLSYLDRLIYIFINKRNFTVAYKYVFEKRKYIDDKNRDQVNRWYLEMAYIYAEMNQKTKAVDHLQAILENLPSPEMQSLSLSNLTKLYIDQQMVEEAKITLNECLIASNDEEASDYNNYLLAKISILENNYSEALQLFQEIFEKEIDDYLLNIANDYLDLMIKMKMFDQALAFINKINNQIFQSKDLEIKKEFYKNKLKFLFGQKKLDDGEELLKQIENIEHSTIQKNALVLEETFEDEKNNEVYQHIKTLVEKIERAFSLTSIAFANKSLREILIEFSKKIDSIVEIDEVNYILYDPIIPFQKLDNQIITYQYKKERLYERIISYDNLKDSVVETMLSSGNDIAIDFNDTKIPLNDVITGKHYLENNIKYIYAIPCIESDNMFFNVIYQAKYNDITSLENTILLKVATKLLSIAVLNMYLKINHQFTLFTYQTTLNNHDLYTIIRNYDNLSISDNLKTLLNLNSNNIKLEDYYQHIIKTDINKVKSCDYSKTKKLEYRLKVNGKHQQVVEKIRSYQIEDLSIYFSTIEIQEAKTFAHQDEQFHQKIQELKSHINDLEFKFSFVRVAADLEDYQQIKDCFGVEPYYLSDHTFIVILENEINQRTLDKYIKSLDYKLSIIRYPRDLVNIDDIIKYSQISLDNDIIYFTEEMYQRYIKKLSVSSLVKNMLTQPLELWYLKLEAHHQKPSYEIRCRIKGISNKDDVRQYLDKNTLIEYETKLFETVNINDISVNYFIILNPKTIANLLQNNKIKSTANLIVCFEGDNYDLIKSITALKNIGIKVFINYQLLEKINIFEIISMNIDGIIVLEGLEKDKRENIIKLANSFNLSLYTNYQYPDFNRCIFRTEQLVTTIKEKS